MPRACKLRPADFIAAARQLLGGPRKPSQVALRRAISTAYYAAFHALAHDCANLLVGGRNSNRSKHAWRQVYRALEHGAAKNACGSNKIRVFPQGIQDFANIFTALQLERHAADYDPDVRFVKSTALIHISNAEQALARLANCDPKDRRAFAAFVLFKARP